ncbi:hypothetical protein [Nocardiopsis sp. HUAS JQ3]|uniref:hypothetical protein n=1 Tax=Nocardiopsis sp. HUAS JQ3 TaxID=3061629 RepID=UPI0023A95140|nr:hypothetical protein [Nocardiopsis sp. HUAS JQ3]WDZ90558.1 hypothetical protein PV789_27340 [Nocardiopsis sp. HUAS JQ3]
MTHTHNNTGAGRPPLAVWLCAPTAHQPPPPGGDLVPVPRRLARRLVAEYTQPGAVVADLTGTSLVAEQAAAAGRFYEVGPSTFPHRPAHGEQEVAWADLTALTVSAEIDQEQQTRERQLRARMLFAATLTRPGGIIAAITAVGHTLQGEVVDPAPGLVRAASCAGLVYLQHVIAITAPLCEAGLGATIPVRGEGFDPDEEEVGSGLPASVADAAASITSPAHLNVSVFRLPKKGHTVTADAPGEVDA